MFFEQKWLEFSSKMKGRLESARNYPFKRIMSTISQEGHQNASIKYASPPFSLHYTKNCMLVQNGKSDGKESHLRPAFPFFTGTSVTFPPDFLALASACRSTDIATCC